MRFYELDKYQDERHKFVGYPIVDIQKLLQGIVYGVSILYFT